jgi:hypothetical protein
MKSKFFVIVLLSVAVGFGACSKKEKKEKSSEKAILEFKVNDVPYDINQSTHRITYIYPKVSEDNWGNIVTTAQPEVRFSPGARLDPPASEERDFLQEQTYTVIAEDGSRQEYTVKAEKDTYY